MAAAAVLTPAAQPDIQYAPDIEKWHQRTAKRLREENDRLQKTLPEGFPAQLQGSLVWEGKTVGQSYDWTYVLNEEQLAEIDDAVRHFKSLNLPLGHIDAATFPLPKTRPELRRLSRELHDGHGFFVIRGVDVDRHTREENIIIYAGVSSHIAAVRGRQDSTFNGTKADVVLSHIKDLTLQLQQQQEARAAKISIGSPAYTADKQVFHTDSGDIVSLFALGEAAEGGASKLASTWRVYNELARTRPDLIHTLAADWPLENFDKSTSERYFSRPLVYHQPASEKQPERILLQYARRYLVGFGALPRSADVPPITEAQAEALDALHFLGERFHVATDFRKGDMQYVNNLAVFHARDGFRDTVDKQRHLVRLWLRDPENAWQTPERLRTRWSRLYDGVTPESQVLPLEAFVRGASNGADRVNK
ncbi:hypothetical protein MCOR07_005398 [Pyricularia oryzae]|nr:hypothetical protein MCOR01_004462 [Pyricularia oryzae]KAI6620587.1 hypothetical protein MCOR07_005398 [Pyricularia oryzae]